MVHDFLDDQALLDGAVEHSPDQIDAALGEWQIRNPQRMIKDLIDIIEGVFLIDDSV